MFVAGLFTAVLTAFYTFRAYFKTFLGELKVPEEAYHHGHVEDHAGIGLPEVHPEHAAPQSFESPWSMTIPLVVLGLGSLFVGLIVEGVPHWMGEFLARSVAFENFAGFVPTHHFDVEMFALSTAGALIGIGLAWWMYVRKPATADQLATAIRPAYELSYRRFLFDEFYSILIVKPLRLLAQISRLFDSMIDGIVDLIGLTPRMIAWALQPVQNGLVQFYALVTVVFVTAFVVVFAWWSR